MGKHDHRGARILIINMGERLNEDYLIPVRRQSPNTENKIV